MFLGYGDDGEVNQIGREETDLGQSVIGGATNFGAVSTAADDDNKSNHSDDDKKKIPEAIHEVIKGLKPDANGKIKAPKLSKDDANLKKAIEAINASGNRNFFWKDPIDMFGTFDRIEHHFDDWKKKLHKHHLEPQNAAIGTAYAIEAISPEGIEAGGNLLIMCFSLLPTGAIVVGAFAIVGMATIEILDRVYGNDNDLDLSQLKDKIDNKVKNLNPGLASEEKDTSLNPGLSSEEASKTLGPTLSGKRGREEGANSPDNKHRASGDPLMRGGEPFPEREDEKLSDVANRQVSEEIKEGLKSFISNRTGDKAMQGGNPLPERENDDKSK